MQPRAEGMCCWWWSSLLFCLMTKKTPIFIPTRSSSQISTSPVVTTNKPNFGQSLPKKTVPWRRPIQSTQPKHDKSKDTSRTPYCSTWVTPCLSTLNRFRTQFPVEMACVKPFVMVVDPSRNLPTPHTRQARQSTMRHSTGVKGEKKQ